MFQVVKSPAVLSKKCPTQYIVDCCEGGVWKILCLKLKGFFVCDRTQYILGKRVHDMKALQRKVHDLDPMTVYTVLEWKFIPWAETQWQCYQALHPGDMKFPLMLITMYISCLYFLYLCSWNHRRIRAITRSWKFWVRSFIKKYVRLAAICSL